MNDKNLTSVHAVLQTLRVVYTARNVSKPDEFMQLFVQDEGIEMIGIDASKREEDEWFEGLERVRYIKDGMDKLTLKEVNAVISKTRVEQLSSP